MQHYTLKYGVRENVAYVWTEVLNSNEDIEATEIFFLNYKTSKGNHLYSWEKG
jgi:hypothetical protein